MLLMLCIFLKYLIFFCRVILGGLLDIYKSQHVKEEWHKTLMPIVGLVQKRKVDPDEAKQYAEENSIMFMETSAKTAANVNELFVQIGVSPCSDMPLKAFPGASRGSRVWNLAGQFFFFAGFEQACAADQ